MATMTAHVLIGKEHLYHGGIAPTHQIALHENSRPVLRVSDFMSSNKDHDQLPRWIPSLDNMMDDIMLMTAMFALKDSTTIDLFEKAAPHEKWQEWLEVYLLEPDVREALYAHVKTLPVKGKMVFTILAGSHILGQVDKLQEYPFTTDVLAQSVTQA